MTLISLITWLSFFKRGTMKILKTIFLLFALFFFSANVFSQESPSAIAYKSARDCYTSLKSDKDAKQKKDNWEKCIAQFQTVVKKYSRTKEGRDAKFSLGRLYYELALVTNDQADWENSVKEFQSFTQQFPTNSMADDAYFQSAIVYAEHLGKKEVAEKNLNIIFKLYKHSDMVEPAKKYQETLKQLNTETLNVEKLNVQPLKSLTIVIDPGHGGSDTGAIAKDGTKEKILTLEISKKLRDSIKKKIKNATVYLTRDKDASISLDDRVKFANSKNADFFISIHTNAAESKKEHGIQTYYLNNATDSASARLAKQENRHSGRDTTDLEKIIATMIQNASTEESRELAKSVHKNLITGLSGKFSDINDEKVRSALFYVLVGVKSPSVLVETSYLSNPKEAARLKNAKYQAALSDSISTGIEEHLKASKSLASAGGL